MFCVWALPVADSVAQLGFGLVGGVCHAGSHHGLLSGFEFDVPVQQRGHSCVDARLLKHTHICKSSTVNVLGVAMLLISSSAAPVGVHVGCQLTSHKGKNGGMQQQAFGGAAPRLCSAELPQTRATICIRQYSWLAFVMHIDASSHGQPSHQAGNQDLDRYTNMYNQTSRTEPEAAGTGRTLA